MNVYTKIFGYLKEYKLSILGYILCTLMSIVFGIVSLGLLFPFLQVLFDVNTQVVPKAGSGFSLFRIIQENVGTVLNEMPKVEALGLICALIVSSIILKNLFLYLSARAMMPVKGKVATRFRIDIFNKVLSLPIGYFTEQKKGDIMARMIGDVGQVEAAVLGALEGWVKDPLQIIINLVVLFSINFKLTLIIIFVFVPIMGFFIGRLGRSLKRPSQIVQQKSGDVLAVMDETLGGLRVIKAFNAEGMIRKKFSGLNNYLLKMNLRIGNRQSLASPMSETLGVIMFAGLLFYGGRQVLNHEIPLDGAAFLAYMILFWNIIDPAKSISGAFSTLQRGTAAVERIQEILDAPVTVEENPDGKKFTTFNNSIEFRNVGFYYNDVPILKNINLKVEKGKTVALVGSSGAGKSTLADLIPRFHDTAEGEILVDGVNIRDYSLHSLRSLMSIVTQEPILFNDTIAANIALGMENTPSREEITEAAKIANAHSFIEKKEEGYDTNIGDRGMKLSGGERQRVTIARAVLKNPPILILDEATSSLDTESERLVQDAINNLMENRTSVVIAHRLSTIRHADEIIVLSKGEIVERGTHNSLIEQNGFYKRLVDMQEVK